MYTLIFNRGMDDERRLYLNTFYERPISNTLNGSYAAVVLAESDIPDIDGIGPDYPVKTVTAITSNDLYLPIEGTYNHISDFTLNYDDTTRRIGLSISLDYVPPVNSEVA